MTTTLSEQRVRRPKAHEKLIQQLMKDGDGPFPSMATTMLFAASVGFANDRWEEFTEAGEPIRYEVFRRYATAEAFIDSLGVLRHPGDPSILSEERLGERVTIFEGYANGGLNHIQGEINASKSRVMDILLEMVRQAGRTRKESDLPLVLDQFFSPPDFTTS
ncbi:DNA phosphorothioation-associated protein 4 [Streptosporangium sp. NPDC051023]|uniref:DNA phosphorothioation-associated protein 4 n=1 Tax=Streptosporangium sp. NPDC051023 TaxID=3155410 RepID=UPI00344EA0E6